MGSIYSSQIRTYNDSDYKYHQSPTWCLQKFDLVYLKETDLEVTYRNTDDAERTAPPMFTTTRVTAHLETGSLLHNLQRVGQVGECPV